MEPETAVYRAVESGSKHPLSSDKSNLPLTDEEVALFEMLQKRMFKQVAKDYEERS